MRIRDGKDEDPGSGMEKICIRDLGKTSWILNTVANSILLAEL
jgi:hypothetical protein